MIIPSPAELRQRRFLERIDVLEERVAYLESCVRSLGCYRVNEWRPVVMGSALEPYGRVEWRRDGFIGSAVFVRNIDYLVWPNAIGWWETDLDSVFVQAGDEWRPEQPISEKEPTGEVKP